MRCNARRIGIMGVAALVSASFISSAQAGVIPWVYDFIFGPNHYGYGPAYGYGPTYSPYVPAVAPMSYQSYYRANCGPCMSPAPRMVCSTCPTSLGGSCGPAGCSSTGCGPAGCATFANYRGAGTACDASKTSWKSDKPPAAASGRKVTSTFEATPVAETDADDTTVNRPPMSTESTESGAALNTTRTTQVEATGGAVSGSAGETDDVGGFEAPVTGTGSSPKTPETGTTTLSPGLDDVDTGLGSPVRPSARDPFSQPTIRDTVDPDGISSPPGSASPATPLPDSVGNGTSLKIDLPVNRVSLRSGYHHARIARSSIAVPDDYVISPETATRLASR